MARLDLHADLQRKVRSLPGVEQALRGVAEQIQTEAARTNAVEAVDTGLMTASWRITTVGDGVVRVHNTARSPDNRANYPIFIEWGWRMRNGRHRPGLRILGRAAATARIT